MNLTLRQEQWDAANDLPVRFFFYGTLMEGSRAGRSVVPRECGLELIGPATCRADMWAVGASFPALIKGEGTAHGELWEAPTVEAAAVALVRCDAIEGYDSRTPASSMYLRERVTLLDPELEAFTYFWNQERSGHSYLSRIPGGDWRRWLTEPSESLPERRQRAGLRTFIDGDPADFDQPGSRVIRNTTGHRPR